MLQRATSWRLRAVSASRDDLVLDGPEDGLVGVEFSDVHLVVTIAVADVLTEPSVRYGRGHVAEEMRPATLLRSFDETVEQLRRAVGFVASLPRDSADGSAGVDFVARTLNGFAFNRINYSASPSGVVAELRFVRAFHAVGTEQAAQQPEEKHGPAA